MCYVKVKSATTGIAQQSSGSSVPGSTSTSSTSNQTSSWTAAYPATLDAFNNDWLLNPHQLEELEGFESAFPLHPTHASNDWIAWLEGMTQEPLLPQKKTEVASPVLDGSHSGDFMIMPSPPFSIVATTASPEFAPFSTDKVIQTKKRVAISFAEEIRPLVKRVKNTEAARKSRARKAAKKKIDSLEHHVDVIVAEKEALEVKVAVLEIEAASFAAREAELKRRIAVLEVQLAESHCALLSFIL
ncbi:hypothetical protein BC830DRAFT_323883 [Chytriomyces sp. MP71]|nr:hypothetical protein BC830DRAFT_323883 [Chytriomyces sp. MP71]